MNVLTQVSNQVCNAFNVVAAATSNAGSQVYNFGGRVVSYVTPAISAVVNKIKSINAPSFLEKAWNLASSRVGISAILLSGGLGALALAYCSENQLHKVALYVLGSTALVFSAYAATMPFGLAKA